MESGSAVNPGELLLRAACFTLSVVLLQGCVSVDSLPHQSYVEEDGERVHCTQYFPKWEMELHEPALGLCGDGGSTEFVAVCIAFYGAYTVITSSIYTVGNVLHWVERDGKCTARARLVPTDSKRQHPKPLETPDT